MSKTFIILGGYGNTGRIVAELLLQETDVQLILAGRNLKKSETLANSLNQKFQINRVSGMRIDAADFQSLKNAFDNVDLVIVASSTSEYVRNVASAAIQARVDYLDFQVSAPKLDTLKFMKAEIEQAACCFITDAGFHPGLPAALVRYAIPFFDSLEKANVGSIIKLNWKNLAFSDSTDVEMIEEVKNFEPIYFKNSQWIQYGWNDSKKFDFALEFGEQSCYPMFLEEMRALPEIISSLTETGFFVGGFNWFVDYLVFPISLVALSLWPHKAVKPIAKLLNWGLKTFSKPPYRTILLLEASGWKDEIYKTMRVKLSHEDGYVLTAIPAVACLLQYLDGSIKKPGLWLQGNLVEPNRLLKDMQRLGVTVEIE